MNVPGQGRIRVVFSLGECCAKAHVPAVVPVLKDVELVGEQKHRAAAHEGDEREREYRAPVDCHTWSWRLL